MNLRSVRKARSLWFVHQEDLNPRGLDLVPILATIQARYRFQLYPTKPEHIYSAKDGIEFARGSFNPDDGKPVEIENLRFYRDGIVADTRHSTALSDAFLADLLGSLVQRHAITFEDSMVQRKAYVSEVVVSTPYGIDKLSDRLRAFCGLLGREVAESREFHPIAIRFGTDSAAASPDLQFSFERQFGVPFQEDRYFSTAPLATDKHLQVLEAWERILAS